MVDEIQNQTTPADSSSLAESSEASGAQVAPTPKERTFTQDEVNRLVGGIKSDAYQKARRETEQEFQRKLSESSSEASKKEEAPLSEEKLQRLIEEEANKRATQQHYDAVANQFASKMQLGIQKHEDFEKVVTKLDLANLPLDIVEWVNGVDNTADVMYDIARNPSKYANILTLSVTSPTLARDELARLSDSLKRNEDATKAHADANKVNAPLDQLKNSRAGVDTGKIGSISDLRNQDWLRG